MIEGRKLTKNEKRRLKKKALKNVIVVDNANDNENDNDNDNNSSSSLNKSNNRVKDSDDDKNNAIEIEYVAADINDMGLSDEMVEEFSSIFEHFIKPEDLTTTTKDTKSIGDEDHNKEQYVGKELEGDDDDDDDDDGEENELSNRQKKQLTRMKEAELKLIVDRPDLVEPDDVNAKDPLTLLYLKSKKNTVPVPRHWNSIRKYLMGKVGQEKLPFQLPSFIAETGIAKIRDAIMEKASSAAARRAARDRVRPKMGMVDIDYQVLYDAFFKYQEKPRLTHIGELYYEGKEKVDASVRKRQPGDYSLELRIALGMPEGNVLYPPPWLANMQRHGPPPGYPGMLLPGVNSKLPLGAAYGTHRGSWGNPPLDEHGRGKYGDVFGDSEEGEDLIDRSYWGSIDPTQDIVEDDDNEEDEDKNNHDITHETARGAAAILADTITTSALDGASHLEVLENTVMDLRKRKGGSTTTSSSSSIAPTSSISPALDADGNPQLYQVIEEQRVEANEKDLFSSDRQYIFSTAGNEDVTTATVSEPDNKGLDSKSATSSLVQAGKKRKSERQTAVEKKMKNFKF